MSTDHLNKFKLTPGTGGRPAGSRNRLTGAFLHKLADDFEQHGDAVIRIARIERPVEYLKIVASILPRELAINDAKLGDMSEEEVAALLETVRELRSKTLATAEPEPAPPHGSVH
jgi:hypothetical protein